MDYNINIGVNDLDRLFFNTTDYELQNKTIGSGNFGEVIIARNINDNHLYAVKIIKTERNFNGTEQMLFMREALILHSLNHPGIIQFKGINFISFNDPTRLSPSILTEYISNGSLKTVLEKERKSLSEIEWTWTKKYIILIGIAHAMKYLHENGVIHRDLKPENVLTDKNFFPHICDFGLSRCFPNKISNSMKLTMSGEIGTPIYMAPELFNDDCHYGPRVDVYAFAILAYEIVTGNLPYSELKNVNYFSLGVKIAKGYRPQFTNPVSERMVNLIERCWNQDASLRPSFDEIFKELTRDLSIIGEIIDQNEFLDYIEMLGEDIKTMNDEEQKHDESSSSIQIIRVQLCI